MTVINFEDLMKEEFGSSQTPHETTVNVGTFEVHNKEALNQAQALFREAKKNRDKIKQLLDEAEAVYEKAKEKVLNLAGYKERDDERMRIQHVKRNGNVDWRRFEVSHPEIRLDPYRKAPTYFWTIKLKE